MRVLRTVGLTLVAAMLASLFRPVTPAAGDPQQTERQRLAAREMLIVEELTTARNQYRESLEKLVAFYTVSRDDTKLKKAREELASLKAVSQYNYVIVAEALGPDLRASKSIPEADQLFIDARRCDTAPPGIDTPANKQKALDAYLALISRYPESTRIGECAYYIAEIYDTQHRDYHRAVVYYEKAAQWDPAIAHPTRIKAARVCYYFLRDMKRAKRLYEAAMESSPNAAYRAEAKAMFDMLKAQGY